MAHHREPNPRANPFGSSGSAARTIAATPRRLRVLQVIDSLTLGGAEQLLVPSPAISIRPNSR